MPTRQHGIDILGGDVGGGKGTISGDTTIAGTLNAGNGGSNKETLAFGGTLGLTGTTGFDIGGTVRGTGHDGSDVTGALTNGGALSLNFTDMFANGSHSFDLFRFVSQTGSFSGVSIIGSYVASLANSSGVWSGSDLSGNSSTFTQSTGALAGMLLGAGMPRRRQRD